MRPLAVIGAPSSAGAFAAGQEDAPRALRDAGFIRALAEHGMDVMDSGDVPGFRWRPDRESPRSMHAATVARVARDVATRVREARANGRMPLVIGGDCTVGLGTVAGCAGAQGSLGLLYFDPHPDLNTPETVPDGAFDWMGVAHMLDLSGAVAEVTGVGGRRPLLEPGDVVLFGASQERSQPGEMATIERLGLRMVSEAQVAGDPAGSASEAARWLAARTSDYVVHFDVDAIDFADAPLSENTDRNVGLTLDAALSALAEMLRSPFVTAVTVTELNPHHAAAVPGLLERFAAGLAGALART